MIAASTRQPFIVSCTMLEWLFPSTCPCSPPAKEWVEYRLHWLCDEFPDNVFTGRPQVLATSEFSPDRYRGSHECIRNVLKRTGKLMDV